MIVILIPYFGSFSLGLSFGWLTRFFLERVSFVDTKAYSACASVLCGGAILGLFRLILQNETASAFLPVIFCYPIGIVIGLLALYPAGLKFDDSMKRWKEYDAKMGEAMLAAAKERWERRKTMAVGQAGK